jgi:type IV secretion system protein TrbI
MTGRNADLPGLRDRSGPTEHAYDTVSGRYLVIPQGSRLIGKYYSIVAHEQERGLVVWQRIILPDGSSIVTSRAKERIDDGLATFRAGVAAFAAAKSTFSPTPR